MSTSRYLTVSCSCGASKHTFTVPTASLPLPSHLCNCDTSRRISGSLLTSYINITHSSSATKPDLSSLTPYHSSDKLIRHFCSTCGTQMYLEYHSDGHFEAATGTLRVDRTEGIVEYRSCMWIGDTKDGGASDWVTSIEGRELKRWREEAGESEEMSLDYYEVIRKEAANTRLEEPVHAHCHCHGVEFWITPPNEASFTAKSFVADLILPYRLNSPLSRKYGSHWWLTNNNARYLAGTCACLSCRSASGFDITFWAFIPNANIFLDAACTQSFPPYTSEHRNQYWGTMKTYQSSEGVTRTFCGRCGANVFWDGGEEKGRDGLIDVAVGLLDAKSGARAEELLGWCADRVSFEECAVNRGLVEALEKGLRDWAERVEGRGVSAWYNSWDHMHKVI